MSRDRRARVYIQHDGAIIELLGDVSSVRANAVLGAIINVTRMYVRILYAALAR